MSYRLGRMAIRCPQCGHKEFKPYIDTATGAILHPTCGRCNRELRCAYHLPPREYFARSGAVLPPRPSPAATAARPRRPDIIPAAVVQQSMLRPSADESLHAGLRHCFGTDIMTRIETDYCFASTTLDGHPAALYWLTDSRGRTRSGKVMVYDADCHRRRDLRRGVSYFHAGRSGFVYQACYYGAHLLPRYPAATVALVESEKTALWLAALWHMHGLYGTSLLPLATGGSGALRVDPYCLRHEPYYRARDIAGRSVLLLPDADATSKWAEVADGLRRAGCRPVRMVDSRHLAESPTDDPVDIGLRYPRYYTAIPGI